MADGYGWQTREEFARALTRSGLASLIIRHQAIGRVNWENMIAFRDHPVNRDREYVERVRFWAQLAADSYAEARALSEYLPATRHI